VSIAAAVKASTLSQFVSDVLFIAFSFIEL
jgi:hypothetical protein